MLKCQLIEIPKKIINVPQQFTNYSQPLSEFLEHANSSKKLQKYLDSCNIKYGDIIHFEQFGDNRNDGKCIFNGEIIIELDSEIDDYGSLPNNFKLEIFGNNACYFSDVIAHNNIVHIDGNVGNRSFQHNLLLWRQGNNYYIQKLKSYDNIEGIFYHVKHNNGKYRWIIYSYSGKNKKQFAKILKNGIFENADECDFDYESLGIDKHMLLMESEFVE